MRVEVKADREYAWFIRPFSGCNSATTARCSFRASAGAARRACLPPSPPSMASSTASAPHRPRAALLVTVRVSQLNWCRFCVDINAMTLIKRAGSSEKVEALANWRESPLFDERERAVLDYTEAMTGLDGVSDEQAARLKPWFDDDAMVELTGLIAFQNMSAKFNAALDIPAGLLPTAGAASASGPAG